MFELNEFEDDDNKEYQIVKILKRFDDKYYIVHYMLKNSFDLKKGLFSRKSLVFEKGEV